MSIICEDENAINYGYELENGEECLVIKQSSLQANTRSVCMK